jgi:hypothetical protein
VSCAKKTGASLRKVSRCSHKQTRHSSEMPSSIWTLKSVVLFLNAGKRKKKENGLLGRKSNTLLRRKRKSEEEQFEEVVLTDEVW